MAPSVKIIIEILVFLAVATMVFGVMRELERLLIQRRRLGQQSVAGHSSATPLMAKRASDNAFFRWIQASTSISDVKERTKLRQALVLAGFDNPNAVIFY